MKPVQKKDLASISETCPKCGDVYLYLQNWREAGVLFVHGYDTDEPSGLRYKVACQVPQPVALGEMTMDEWRAGKNSSGS